MGIKTYKPTSAGRRRMSGFDFEEITKSRPEKKLVRGKRSTGGRNNQGRTTARFRGGGHRRRYREIDFRREKVGIPARVAAIEYDPNRSARIALLHYADGEKRYIVAPQGLAVGEVVVSSRNADVKPGNVLPLRFIPLGTTIYGIELKLVDLAQRQVLGQRRHFALQIGLIATGALQIIGQGRRGRLVVGGRSGLAGCFICAGDFFRGDDGFIRGGLIADRFVRRQHGCGESRDRSGGFIGVCLIGRPGRVGRRLNKCIVAVQE
jgi:hypothetical protein